VKLGLIALTLTAGAAAVSPAVTAPAPVAGLAMDGANVAFATGTSPGDCDRVWVWNSATQKLTRLARTTNCIETSTGHGIAALSIAGRRVLWLHFVGGNIREWSLFTATTSAPRPKRLRFVARDVDEPPPIVLGEGDSGRLGDILPYAIDDEVVALRTNGSRRFSWHAPARVLALDAKAGQLAVAYAGGHVAVLDLAGRVLRDEAFAGDVQAVQVLGERLLVQYGRTLELRDQVGSQTWRLPAGARLRDMAAEGAYYVVRGAVRMLALAGSRDEFVATGTDVQVEGLFVAVAQGRRVSVIERR
jgi:hypothetical protein